MPSRKARILAEMKERRHQLLQRSLLPDEAVLAEGRATWLSRGEIQQAGSTHDHLWLTDRRLLWCTIWGMGRPWTLPLDAVTSFEEQTFDGHRYLLRLRHNTVSRIEWAPRWRFLWWSWGNAHVPQSRVETIFAFSRGDARIAGSLRAELDRRGIPGTRLPSPKRSPRDSGTFLRQRRTKRPFRRGDHRD